MLHKPSFEDECSWLWAPHVKRFWSGNEICFINDNCDSVSNILAIPKIIFCMKMRVKACSIFL